MKRYIGFAAAAAATAIVGAALAADGDQFLIKGDATKGMLEQSMLNITTAEKIAQACVAEATKQGVKVSIAIMDQFGEPIYFYRMDGQGKAGIDTAFMKAKTVLNTRAPSKAIMNQVAQGRSSELRQYTFGNFNNSGGLPIVINGNQFIGAIGVGGSAPRVFDPNPWSDEICAWRALNQVMGKQPDLLPDIRPAAQAGGAGRNGG
jgi:glc operon protein GlcG